MKKKFRIDASKQQEVAKALEGLKNETLQAISAEMIAGGSQAGCTNFTQFSRGGGGGGWIKDAYILS
jgi:hypothetical protein